MSTYIGPLAALAVLALAPAVVKWLRGFRRRRRRRREQRMDAHTAAAFQQRAEQQRARAAEIQAEFEEWRP